MNAEIFKGDPANGEHTSEQHPPTINADKGRYDYLLQLKEADHLKYEDELRRLLMSDPEFLPTFEQLREAYRNTDEIWEDEVRNKPRYELLNRDYLRGLAKHLSNKIEARSDADRRPVRILEIGSGDGRMAHFLREELSEIGYVKGVDFELYATDSFDWNIKPLFHVDKVKDREALKTYKPDIVVALWFPGESFDTSQQKPHPDSNLDFVRQESTVSEYILIGQPDATIAGSELKRHNGFVVSELEHLSKLQVCRNDDPLYIGQKKLKSQTFSFVRESNF